MNHSLWCLQQNPNRSPISKGVIIRRQWWTILSFGLYSPRDRKESNDKPDGPQPGRFLEVHSKFLVRTSYQIGHQIIATHYGQKRLLVEEFFISNWIAMISPFESSSSTPNWHLEQIQERLHSWSSIRFVLHFVHQLGSFTRLFHPVPFVSFIFVLPLISSTPPVGGHNEEKLSEIRIIKLNEIIHFYFAS